MNRTGSAKTRAGRREGTGFTLVELLVVVSMIVLLVSLLLPELSAARELARATACRSRLHQLGIAFHDARDKAHEGRMLTTMYPPYKLWPSIPMNVFPHKEIYLCPDEPVSYGDAGQLQFRSQEGWFLSFEAGPYCIVKEGPNWTEYYFEDLLHGDFDIDDVIVRLYHDTPERVVIERAGSAGYTQNAIYYKGEELISDCSHSVGASFLLGGGLTNYGINAQVALPEVAPNTVVLLDYDRLDANRGEDIGQHLRDSARHRGRVNALMHDGSVRPFGPSELDPVVSAAAVKLWSPEE